MALKISEPQCSDSSANDIAVHDYICDLTRDLYDVVDSCDHYCNCKLCLKTGEDGTYYSHLVFCLQNFCTLLQDSFCLNS